jgi:hypothetical protein
VFYEDQFDHSLLQDVRARVDVDKKVESVYRVLKRRSVWPADEVIEEEADALQKELAYVNSWLHRYERVKSSSNYFVNRGVDYFVQKIKKLK